MNGDEATALSGKGKLISTGRRHVEADLGKEAGAKTGGGDMYAEQEDASVTQEPSEEHGWGQRALMNWEDIHTRSVREEGSCWGRKAEESRGLGRQKL